MWTRYLITLGSILTFIFSVSMGKLNKSRLKIQKNKNIWAHCVGFWPYLLSGCGPHALYSPCASKANEFHEYVMRLVFLSPKREEEEYKTTFWGSKLHRKRRWFAVELQKRWSSSREIWRRSSTIVCPTVINAGIHGFGQVNFNGS